MTFSEAAINSANIYHEYLQDKNSGIIRYPVSDIRLDSTIYVLTLVKNPKSTDALKIRIHDVTYGESDIRVLEHNEKDRQLRIQPSAELRDILDRAKPSDIFAVVDILFLIKRVERWYETYGNKIELPTKYPYIPLSMLSEVKSSASIEQEHAIGGALSNPFSYIWGAPGTGKTRFVLARCIVAYFKQEKRILITAPTNNAIEQTLYGVLSVFEELNIPIENIVRLGIPSDEFCSKYPPICENRKIAHKLTAINDRIMEISTQLSEIQQMIKLYPRYHAFLEYSSAFETCENQLCGLLQEFCDNLSKKKSVEASIAVTEGKIILAKERIVALDNSISNLSPQIARLNMLVLNYSSGLRKMLMPRQKKLYANKLQKTIREFDNLSEECDSLKDELHLLESNLQESYETRAVFEQKVEELSHLILGLTTFCKDFDNLPQKLYIDNLESLLEYVNHTFDSIRSKLNQKSITYSRFNGMTEQSLRNKETTLKNMQNELINERSDIESSSANLSLDECLILAGTIDAVLARISPDGDYIPEHIFLDEAGYCPLIKAASLLSFGCSVTFLGDHMQLPPICEMDDANIDTVKYAPVSLWSQSALYTEDIFSKNPQTIFADYIKKNPPTFRRMAKFDLTHTYRFGEELASVLAQHIYQNDFHGNPDCDTKIYYIDAKKTETVRTRTSQQEVDAICSYVAEHQCENIGIISPYKKQRDLIYHQLSDLGISCDDMIMTVHGSQGREWDTVLFSVTDTINPWFTNSLSQISNGKCVINTAVSRARKKLILVCDAEYWMPLKKQLIGNLLSVANKL